MSRYPVLVAAAVALLALSPALGQQDPAADYPTRPVKIIVSVPAGGGTPQDMAKLKHDETERWTKVIREAGIQPE